MTLGQPSAATKGLCLDLGRDFPIAIEQPTASRCLARASNSSHGTHHEQLNRQGREGTRRTQRTAGGLFFASFAFLRGLGCSFSLGIVSDRATRRRTRGRRRGRNSFCYRQITHVPNEILRAARKF